MHSGMYLNDVVRIIILVNDCARITFQRQGARHGHLLACSGGRRPPKPTRPNTLTGILDAG
jgi:hypothetical protein